MELSSVHVYGKASILEKDELIEELTIMLEKYEGNRENPVLWDKLSPHLLERELKSIDLRLRSKKFRFLIN